MIFPFFVILYPRYLYFDSLSFVMVDIPPLSFFHFTRFLFFLRFLSIEMDLPRFRSVFPFFVILYPTYLYFDSLSFTMVDIPPLSFLRFTRFLFFFFKIPISRNRSFTISIDIPFLCYTLSKISFFRKNRYTYDIREIL